MASALLQVRVDETLKQQAAVIYEQLGLDLPSAVRMFLRRSVAERGIPFGTKLDERSFAIEDAVLAMREASANALANGAADMSLEEINDEIDAVRRAR